MEYSAYLYGSSSRGEALPNSDVDILIVCEDSSGFDINQVEFPAFISNSTQLEDISIYGLARITQMHRKGHLFTWHLYTEAKFIAGDVDRLKQLGEPTSYSDFYYDVEPLVELLRDIPHELDSEVENFNYEAGLIYVCARNIAMAASLALTKRLNFSAYAPFYLGENSNEFPLDREAYSALRQSRLAGTRGMPAVNWKASELLNYVGKINVWAEQVLRDVEGEFNETHFS
jgi:hypothetical protein